MEAATVQSINHTNSEDRMQFQIHFRGAGVFVARGRGNLTEVLFPNAETKGPPDGDAGSLRKNGKPLGKGMKHADKSDATLHFAGALVVGPGNTATYRKLAGRLVTGDKGTAGAKPTGNFFSDLPPLADVITEADSKLKLVTPIDPTYPGRVATRFEIDSGAAAASPRSKKEWLLDGGKHGGSVSKHFALGVTWTVDSEESIEFKVLNLDRSATGEDPIVLDDKHTQVYFYNFDIGLPTVLDLTSEEDPFADTKDDNDFKWSYALFDRVDSSKKKWQDWLKGDSFPTPSLIGPLVRVSTCFQIVWTDE
jgi:hypothetical protein